MKITVFTPTYNRKDTLKRLYDSLLNQTSYDFEWLIIDDGSTDETEETVKEYLAQDKFKVRYYKQENGGKHRAYNKALNLAQGEFFFTVDSDDWLKEDSIENIVSFTENVNSDEWIFAYKIDEKGKRLSDEFPKDVAITSSTELLRKYNCHGEFSIIFPIKLARKYPFKTFEGENFITEATMYDVVNKNAKLRLLAKTITICEYQEDGLSNNLNRIMKNNPAGYCLYFMQRIDIESGIKNKLITAGKYNCFKMFAGKKACKYEGEHKLINVLSKPVGLFFWLYYKMVRHF